MEIKILSPFRHTVHVDYDFTWSGEQVDESFAEIKLLGEGSYGCVYKTKSPAGKMIAIKKVIFDDECLSESEDESSDKETSYDDYLNNNNNNHKQSKQNDKGINETERKKLTLEIELLKRISSPYVVQYYGSRWKSDRELWIMMEYCKFGSVRDVMDYVNAELLLENQIATIMYFTLQGLCYLHSLVPPIVHFDIKANNLLLSNDGTVKVCFLFLNFK